MATCQHWHAVGSSGWKLGNWKLPDLRNLMSSGQIIPTKPPRSHEMVVKSKGTFPKSPENSGLGIILICPDEFITNGTWLTTLQYVKISFSTWDIQKIQMEISLDFYSLLELKDTKGLNRPVWHGVHGMFCPLSLWVNVISLFWSLERGIHFVEWWFIYTHSVICMA